MRARIRADDDLHTALVAAGVEPSDDGGALVFQPVNVTNWPEARIELTEAFRQSKGAAVEGRPVVYIVGIDDLLGRSGPVPAMVAAGLASAARTLALELEKQGVPVNTIVVGRDSDPVTVAAWSLMLLQAGPSGPTGELIHLGGAQIGKALS